MSMIVQVKWSEVLLCIHTTHCASIRNPYCKYEQLSSSVMCRQAELLLTEPATLRQSI